MAKNERNAGRKRMEGGRHMYTVAQDAHEYIMKHGGGRWLTDIVRVIIAKEQDRIDRIDRQEERERCIKVAQSFMCGSCVHADNKQKYMCSICQDSLRKEIERGGNNEKD